MGLGCETVRLHKITNSYFTPQFDRFQQVFKTFLPLGQSNRFNNELLEKGTLNLYDKYEYD